MMTKTDVHALADQWIAAWNRRDVPTVLAFFTDDVIFTSPKAQMLMGTPSVRGSAALRRYWLAALDRFTELNLSLDRLVFDPETQQAIVFYRARLNGHAHSGCEWWQFNPQGKITAGEALYGAELQK
jgi:ketosteroid isomerase-like protein